MLTMLCMVALGVVGANAQETTLFSADFSSSEWSKYSTSKSITSGTTVNGIYFKNASSVQNGQLVMEGGNMKTTNYWSSIVVTGVNGSITVKVSAPNTIKMVVNEGEDGTKDFTGTAEEKSLSDGVITYTYTMTGTGNSAILYFGRGGSKRNKINSITITTPDASLTKLTAPTITANGETGEVTIAGDANAKSIVYTIDGKDPTSESTVYTAPFTVEDGTVVKAMALGDNTKYSNSSIASDTVYLNNVAVATPTFTTFNGTVGLSTETANATIEYSLDGSKYQAYTKPFTLTENGTVYARATRAGKTSEVASQEVTAIAKPEGTETVYISYWDDMNGKNSATNADGYTLAITGNTTKNWSKGNIGVTINGTDYNTIKLSNGAQNTLTLPAGKVAKRITFYSNVNADNIVCGWKEVAGTSYENGDGDYKKIPMGSFRSTDPDVRVYALDDATSITFTNAGAQLQFVIALDVADAPTATTETASITSAGYATYVTKNIVDLSSNAKVKAFTAKYDAASSTITLTPTKATVPAGTALVLKGAEGSYNFTVGATAEEVANNDLKATTEPLTADGSQWILAKLGDQVGFAPATPETTIPAGKAYLVIKGSASSKGFIGISDGDATGINQISAAQNTLNENAPMFNLAGQQVTKAYKGVILQNGKKFINK